MVYLVSDSINNTGCGVKLGKSISNKAYSSNNSLIKIETLF